MSCYLILVEIPELSSDVSVELLVKLFQRDFLTGGKLNFLGPDFLDDSWEVFILVALEPLILEAVKS